jgi:hypothetical protein
MGAPRAFAGLALLGAGIAAVLWRQRAGRLNEHVDLYYSDGSMVSFEPGSPAGDRLLPLARRALAAARG